MFLSPVDVSVIVQVVVPVTVLKLEVPPTHASWLDPI
jgi:hypothetical protein